MWAVCVKTLSLELEGRKHRIPATYRGVRIPYAPLWREGMAVPETDKRVEVKGREYGVALEFGGCGLHFGPFPRNPRPGAALRPSQLPICTSIWACPPQLPAPALRQHTALNPLRQRVFVLLSTSGLQQYGH